MHGNGTEVIIRGNGVELQGYLNIPENACCIVIFAHGSGSSRNSRRNLYVSRVLNSARIATLLFDLLTGQEALDRGNVFDIDLLSDRLSMATEWVRKDPGTSHLQIGYFGASTGAAAALKTSTLQKNRIFAVVSRGGRPDLAWEFLDHVETPTLLIVGSGDYGVVELNDRAYGKLRCIKRMEMVPNATHLFEEPGALEKVAELAGNWFTSVALLRKKPA